MRLWTADPRTGRYPALRVVWNLLWLLPLQITRVLFCACVLMSGGLEDAERAWRDTR